MFPCGSEIGLELMRALKHNTHFELLGASSVEDHGRFSYPNYVGDLPFFSDVNFLKAISSIVKDFNITAVYPTTDAVAEFLKRNEHSLGCMVVGSSSATTTICSSKRLTYQSLHDVIPVPRWYTTLDSISEFPIFIKPEVGYGSRNVLSANSRLMAERFLAETQIDGNFIFCELLPGTEFTIDCFTDRHGELRFSGVRERRRISNGISVNTIECKKYENIFAEFASNINKQLNMRGAWFFQMKEDKSGTPKLLEVAARFGGSSSLFRAKGVNFALLSLFDAFDVDIDIELNSYSVELDRALSNKYKLNLYFDKIYVDYDDTLIVNDSINADLISFLYEAINVGKKVILLTKHIGNISESLKKYRISELFDQVIHISTDQEKSNYIQPESAIFIDDSYYERSKVRKMLGINTFSIDMVETITPLPKKVN